MLQGGKTPNVEAAVVKDLGTNWEQALPGRVRGLLPPAEGDESYAAVMRFNTLIAPKLTIQIPNPRRYTIGSASATLATPKRA